MAGLTPEGFIPKTADEIRETFAAALRAALGDDLDTSPESVFGQLIATVADGLAELWELGALAYAARDPAGATLAALDALCALTGTVRRAATKGRVVLRLSLAAATTIPAGAVAAVLGQPTNRWVTIDDAVNTDVSPADVDVVARAETAGVFTANAGTITVIATPTTGWLAVTNPADAAPGQGIETDAQLRLRREQELSDAGTATLPAIRRDLLEITQATTGEPWLVACVVEENDSAYVDAFGRPPHSIEVVAQFRTGLSVDELAEGRQALADQLFASKPGGITTFGQFTGTVTEETTGQVFTLRHTEPDDVPIYITADLAVDPATYVGDAAVKDAFKAYGDTLLMGNDVRVFRLEGVLTDLAGVVDLSALRIGRSSGVQTAANIAIGPRERATFDTANMTVTTVVATP